MFFFRFLYPSKKITDEDHFGYNSPIIRHYLLTSYLVNYIHLFYNYETLYGDFFQSLWLFSFLFCFLFCFLCCCFLYFLWCRWLKWRRVRIRVLLWLFIAYHSDCTFIISWIKHKNRGFKAPFRDNECIFIFTTSIPFWKERFYFNNFQRRRLLFQPQTLLLTDFIDTQILGSF